MESKIWCNKLNRNFYSLHSHTSYEIIVYCNIDNGKMCTENKALPCCNGDVVVIPPKVLHGTKSDKLVNSICIRGDFLKMPPLDDVVIIKDNSSKEALTLANLIYNNRFSSKEYLMSLCNALINFLVMNMKFKTDADKAVSDIIAQISDSFSDPLLSTGEIMDKSGYARDYIRSHFKKITNKTPTEFLTQVRINHACFLISVYQCSVPLSEIALQCGYSDYIYFSRSFKSVMKVSPNEYRKIRN